MRLPFLPEAVEELDWEVLYLEIERPNWGEKFHEEVRKRVDLAADHPELGQGVPDIDPELGVRRFVIPRFGCSVIIALHDGEPTVIAIAPGRKEPGYWRERLK
jgi:plasmid stabilization system protein ParE